MKTLFPLLMALFFSATSFSQTITSVIYLSRLGKTTTKDSAFTYARFYKHSDVWLGKEYYINTEVTRSEGNYRDSTFSKPIGFINSYRQDGTLEFVKEFDDAGNVVSVVEYHDDGNKKSEVTLKNNAIVSKIEWDHYGREIKKEVRKRKANR